MAEGAVGTSWAGRSRIFRLLTAWVLTRSGIDTTPVHPPTGGRAPGWQAGLVVARRSGWGTAARADAMASARRISHSNK